MLLDDRCLDLLLQSPRLHRERLETIAIRSISNTPETEGRRDGAFRKGVSGGGGAMTGSAISISFRAVNELGFASLCASYGGHA